MLSIQITLGGWIFILFSFSCAHTFDSFRYLFKRIHGKSAHFVTYTDRVVQHKTCYRHFQSHSAKLLIKLVGIYEAFAFCLAFALKRFHNSQTRKIHSVNDTKRKRKCKRTREYMEQRLNSLILTTPHSLYTYGIVCARFGCARIISIRMVVVLSSLFLVLNIILIKIMQLSSFMQTKLFLF